MEIVRAIYDAVARRDGVTPSELYAGDIVWDISRSRRAGLGMEPVYQAHEGVRRFWRDAVSVFGEIDFEIEEFTAAGDQVLAVGRELEVGRASGAPVETAHVAVWTLTTDRKVSHMQLFDDREQALETVGLRE